MGTDAQSWLSRNAKPVAPDAPAASPVPIVEPGQGESAARGGLQGASLGWADELSALIDTGVSKVPGVRNVAQLAHDPSKPPLTDPSKTYEQRRDSYRGANAAAKEANPWTYGASEIGGALVSPVGAGKTLSQFAGVGAAAGLGHSEAATPGGMAADAGLGAGIGAVGGKAAQAIGSKVVGGAPARADDRAFATLGDEAKQLSKNKLAAQEPKIRAVLKEPAIRRELGNPARMETTADMLRAQAGTEAAKIYHGLDGKAGGMRVDDVTIPMFGMISKMKSESRDPAAIRAIENKVEQFRSGIGADSKKPVPSSEVRRFLTKEVQGPAFGRADPLLVPTPAREALQELSGIMKDSIDAYARKNGTPEVADRLLGLNDRITAYSLIEKAAHEQVSAQKGAPNWMQAIGRTLSSHKGEGMGGMIGYAVGGPVGAGIGTGLGYLGRKGAPMIDEALASPAGQRMGTAAAGRAGMALPQPVIDEATAARLRAFTTGEAPNAP